MADEYLAHSAGRWLVSIIEGIGQSSEWLPNKKFPHRAIAACLFLVVQTVMRLRKLTEADPEISTAG
jgi:hypothetical protein